MNDLTTRKRLIIAQADLHRQFIELECQRVLQRMGRTQDLVSQKPWWLLGGAAVVGFLLAPKGLGLPGWLPLVSKLLRIFESTDH